MKDISLTDPHKPTPPAIPSYLKEGEILWPYEKGRFIHAKGTNGMGLSSLYHECINRLSGFAVKDGIGKITVVNSPNWFVGYNIPGLFPIRNGCIQTKATIIGAVMRKV